MQKTIHVGTRIVKLLVLMCLLLLVSLEMRAQNCSVNADVNQTVCGASTLNLSGLTSGVLSGTATWSQVGGPLVTITTPTSLTSSITGFTENNAYVFRLSATCGDGTLVYDDVTYTISAPSTTNAGTDQASCPGTNVITLAATPPPVGGSGVWTGSTANVTVNNTGSPTSTVTLAANYAGSVNLTWTVTKGNCSSSDVVRITDYGGVSPVDANTATSTNIVNVNTCYGSTAAATMAASLGGSGGGQGGLWTVISGPNVPTITAPTSNTSTITNLIQGTYKLWWTVTGACASGSSSVTVIVKAPTGANTTASAGTSQTYCDGLYSSGGLGSRSTVTLNGNAPLYSGEVGLWTLTARPSGSPIPTIVSPNNRSTTVTGLGYTGTYTFRWTISNPSNSGCSSNSSVSIIFVDPASSITVTGGGGTLACGASSTNITWTAVGGNQTDRRILSGPSGNSSYPSYPTSYVTNVASGATLNNLTVPGTYVVEFLRKVNGSTNSCDVKTAQVSVVVSASPTESNAGTTQVLACNVNSTVLAGNKPKVGTGKWYQVYGPNTATMANSLLNNTGISAMVPGIYSFRWLITGGDACPSQQKDVFVVVSSPAPTTSVAGSSITTCYGSSVTLTGNVPARREVGVWTVSPSAGVVFSDINSPSATVTGLASETAYTFYWTISNACGSSTSSVVITTTAIPGPSPSSAGSDQCQASGTSVITLAGNTSGSGTGMWSKVSGGSATITDPNLSNTTVTGLSNGIYTFEWARTLGSCVVTRDTMQVTIGAPLSANAGPDQSVCGSSATFAANTPPLGTGTWSQIAGPAGFTITDLNSPTSTITGLVDGVYTFRWTLSNGSSCGSSYDDVVLNVSIPPSIADAGSPQTICAASTSTVVSLSGNIPTSGSGLWTVSGGAPNIPTFSNVRLGTSTLTNLIEGTYTLVWTISSGGNCSVSSSSVAITVIPQAVSNVTQDLCNVSSYELVGKPAGSTGTWSISSGPGGTVSTTGQNTAAATGLVPGNYEFKYEINQAGCPVNSAISLVNISAQPTFPNAGPDQNVCMLSGTATVTLAGNTIVTGSGQWTLKSGSPAGSTILTDTSPTSNVVFTSPGIYYFLWTATNGVCSSVDEVKVTVYNATATAIAGPDQNVCGTVATMQAIDTGGVGLGNWTQTQVDTAPNVATITSPILYNTTITGLIPGVYKFRWSISNGPCVSSYDDVIITVSAAPTQPNAGTDQVLCNSSTTTLAANTILSGSGTWSQVGGTTTGVVITDSTSPTSEVTGLTSGVYSFQWTATNGACTLSDQVQITNYALPTPSVAGSDIVLCYGSTLNLAANTPTSGTGTWSQVSGPSTVTFVSPNSPTSKVLGVIASVTPYVFRWSIVNGNCPPSTSTVTVTINDIPSIADAGPDQTGISTCGLTSVTLAAVAPTVGSGEWSVVSGTGGTFANVAIRNTSFSGIAGNTYTLRWTVTNGICKSTNDMVVKFNSQVVANAGPDQITSTTCGLTTIALAANAATPGTGAWSIVSGVGGSVATPASATSNFSGVAGSSYTLRWTITNALCATTSDDINIKFNTNTTAPIVGTITQPTCATPSASVVFSGLPATGTWTLTRIPGGATTTGTGTSKTVTGVPPGATYTYTVQDGISLCTSVASSNVIVSALPVGPSAPVIGTITQPTCSVQTGSVVLSGLPATGTWTLVRTPGGTTTTGTGTSKTITGLPAGVTYTFTVKDGISLCTSVSSANIIVNSAPVVPIVYAVTGGGSYCSGGTGVVVGLSNSEVGVNYQLKVGGISTGSPVAGTGGAISFGNQVTAGNYTALATNTTSVCSSTMSGSADVIILPQPLSSVTFSNATCYGTNNGWIQVTASGGTSPYLYSKDNGANYGSAEVLHTFNNLPAGLYKIRVKDANGCESTINP